MKLLYIIMLFVSAVTCYGEKRGFGTFRPALVKAPLVRLLAAPQELEGKAVQTMGVVGYDGSFTLLYLTSEHHRMRDIDSAIVLGFGIGLAPLKSTDTVLLDGRWVFVQGEFTTKVFEGGFLDNINHLAILPLDGGSLR